MTFFVAEGPPSATFLCPPTDKTTQHKSTETLHVGETTEYTEHTEKGQHVKKKPQNTQNTLKGAPRSTASVGQQERRSSIP
ncbi:MAG: hypothetical protein J6V91_02770, partial [Kiritimatiellae bacterium]|nr:hypothetical protein [Kiritimatiellia bacterium]